MNNKEINYAIMELNNNENGELILPVRKKLWLELGEFNSANDSKNITSGKRKRVDLAKNCVQKVIKLWDMEFGKDNYLGIIFQGVDQYMNGKIFAEELENLKNKYIPVIEEIAYTPKYERIGLIGLAGIYVANIALYDELLLQNTDDDDLDDDLDSFTWDTSYLISLVYSGCNDETDFIWKKREFWNWYLNKISEL